MTIPALFGDNKAAEGLWEDVKNHYQQQGGNVSQLEKEVNVGYISDPTGTSKFVNDPNAIEPNEVLEWAYQRPDYYHYLHKHHFLIPFGMNDFDPDIWPDDQKRFELQRAVNKIKNGYLYEEGIKTITTDEHRRELARRIYDWSLNNLFFYGDCAVESPDYAAILKRCGACTETSNVMYFLLKYAGLNPSFYVENNWEPSMRWLDRFERGGAMMMMGHVLVGIPLSKGKTLYIDRANEKFDEKHPHSIAVSPRSYAALAIQNLKMEAMQRGDAKTASASMQVLENLASDDLFIYFDIMRAAFVLGNKEAFYSMLGNASTLFKDHPALVPLAHITQMNAEQIFTALTEKNSGLNAELATLEKSDPKIAAEIRLVLGRSIATALSGAKEGLAAAIQSGQGEQTVQKFNEFIDIAMDQFSYALTVNPNSVIAYMGFNTLVKQFLSILPDVSKMAAAKIEPLLNAHPNHTPFLYMAGVTLLAKLNNRNIGTIPKETLDKATSCLVKITELEKDHPLAYLRLAEIKLITEDFSGMNDALANVKRILGDKLPGGYYMTSLAYAFNNGNPETLKTTIEEILANKPQDGLDFILDFFQERLVFAMDGEVENPGKLKEIIANHSFFKNANAIIDSLIKYPRARASIEAVQAKLAVAYAFLDGEEEWKRRFAFVSEPNAPAVQENLNEGLEYIDAWLSKASQPEATVDHLCGVLDFLKRDLPESFNDRLLSINIELVNNYLALGKTDKAKAELEKMIKIDPTKAIMFYVQRVVNMTYKSIEINIRALDGLYERREEIAPELLRKVYDAYNAFIPRLSDNPALRDEVIGKTNELGKMLNIPSSH